MTSHCIVQFRLLCYVANGFQRHCPDVTGSRGSEVLRNFLLGVQEFLVVRGIPMIVEIPRKDWEKKLAEFEKYSDFKVKNVSASGEKEFLRPGALSYFPSERHVEGNTGIVHSKKEALFWTEEISFS